MVCILVQSAHADRSVVLSKPAYANASVFQDRSWMSKSIDLLGQLSQKEINVPIACNPPRYLP